MKYIFIFFLIFPKIKNAFCFYSFFGNIAAFNKRPFFKALHVRQYTFTYTLQSAEHKVQPQVG